MPSWPAFVWRSLLSSRRALLPVCRRGAGGPASIKSDDLKEWLSYIASDELQGRAVFSDGPRPGGRVYQRPPARRGASTPVGDTGILSPDRSRARRESRPAIRRSPCRSATRRRTFADGEAVVFPRNAGAKQRLTIDRVEFAGYGLDVPATHHVDLAGRDMTGAAVVWLGADGPKEVDAQKYRLPAATAGPLRRRTTRRRRRASAPNAGGRARGQRRPRRAGRPAAAAPRRSRLHHRRTPGQAGAADVTGQGRVLRVPVQPRAGQIRRAEAQGAGAGAAPDVSARRREADVQRRRGLRNRPHAAHPERRRDRRRVGSAS